MQNCQFNFVEKWRAYLNFLITPGHYLQQNICVVNPSSEYRDV